MIQVIAKTVDVHVGAGLELVLDEMARLIAVSKSAETNKTLPTLITSLLAKATWFNIMFVQGKIIDPCRPWCRICRLYQPALCH